MAKKLKKIVVIIGIVAIMLLTVFPLTGAANPNKEIGTLDELKAIFPNHYFFDFGEETDAMFVARTKQRRSGCSFYDEYLWYRIVFGSSHGLEVQSNMNVDWTPSNNISLRTIDNIEITVYFLASSTTGNYGLSLLFVIDGIRYSIGKSEFASEEQLQEKLEQFLIETITPAITNRKKGATL